MAEPFEEAVRGFWSRRGEQTARQVAKGRVDAGLRGAVTGGTHLDQLRDLIADVFVAAGVRPESIFRTAGVALPGHYRPGKKFDLVVVERGRLVAALELKSHVGPSFSNNFNNRAEEAIGNAVDVWRAFEEGTFGSLRPWLAYVLLLEAAPASIRPVALPETVFPVEPVFEGTSYRDRYGILCNRLVKERLYDAVWFLTSESADGGTVEEPHTSLSFAALTAAIYGRVAYIRALDEAGVDSDIPAGTRPIQPPLTEF